MSTQRTLTVSLCTASIALATLSASRPAGAQGFADPPSAHQHARVIVAEDDNGRCDDEPSSPAYDPGQSLVRLLVGPAGKFSTGSAEPGLLVAVDVGRGPTGLRLSGAWLSVGDESGLAQYTGELTVDFGGRSRVRPVIGAGGGVARTSSSVREDGTTDLGAGATLGIGVVRAGLGVMLPFSEADARVALDVTGSFPAIRASNAPDLSPWVLASITVGVGF